MNSIYSCDSTRFLPVVLQNDPDTLAVAKAIGGEYAETALEIYKNIIYARIDELSEEILDVLAYDLHVDWYDYSYDIETKRATIKNSVEIHRKMGTKYAVEKATSNVYPGAKVEEWFEYGGQPYTFRVHLDINESGLTAEQQVGLYEKICFYKNARSHFDSLRYDTESAGEIKITGWVEIAHYLTISAEEVVF